MVADLRSVINNKAHWDINFTKLVDDWEVDFVSSFFNVLYSARVGQKGDDSLLCWMEQEFLGPFGTFHLWTEEPFSFSMTLKKIFWG